MFGLTPQYCNRRLVGAGYTPGPILQSNRTYRHVGGQRFILAPQFGELLVAHLLVHGVPEQGAVGLLQVALEQAGDLGRRRRAQSHRQATGQSHTVRTVR